MMSEEGLVFATKQNIYLVSTEGEIKWTYPLVKRYVSSILPSGNTLLISMTGESTGVLRSLDLESKEENWTVVTGIPSEEIVASHELVCVPAMVEINKEPIKVIPTKRWEGSEDLLEKALKSTGGARLEPILMGLDPRTGESLWTFRKTEGEFKYANGIIYVLTHYTRLMLMDASADSSELARLHSTLTAYDAITGERIWQQGIDGRASRLRLAFGAALMVSRPDDFSISANPDRPKTMRLIAISLH